MEEANSCNGIVKHPHLHCAARIYGEARNITKSSRLEGPEEGADGSESNQSGR